MPRLARPPGPTRAFPFMRLLKMSREPLTYFSQLRSEYGPLVHFSLGPTHLYLVSDPELIREVLVTHAKVLHKDRGLDAAKLLLGQGLLTSEGDFHKRQRRLAQPAFHHGRIASYAEVMSRFAARHVDGWRDGQELEVNAEMMRLALAIVGKTLFDTDTEDDAKEIAEALDVVMELFTFLRLPFARILDRIPVLPSTRRFRKAKARLDATVFRLIREHRGAGDKGDLMSMLIAAQDTEGDGGQMTDEQLRDEAMTIFLAGHETTANALS
ncbi:MAG: cytochrome P450, partial [Myxococcales bacterium]